MSRGNEGARRVPKQEEIDVVSVGDKNLPTNPTARDRRALQSTVASKIRKQQAEASSRHAASGSAQYGGSCLHRQQHNRVDDDRYVSGSHSLNASGGGGVNLMLSIYPTPAGSTTISGANTPLLTGSGCSSVASSPPPVPSSGRKRSGITSSSSVRGSNGKHHRGSSSSVKRSRRQGKKSASSTSTSRAADPHCDVTPQEPDSAEKRNLHNNMERQRRIGLKNLFEELKRQIPSLRDKDRAPKVNILREAALLCTRLNDETEELMELRQRQKKLYERVRHLRSSIHSQRHQAVE